MTHIHYPVTIKFSFFALGPKFTVADPRGRRINNLLVFDLTLLFSPKLQILCIALATEMIFNFGGGKTRRSKDVSYLHGVPRGETIAFVKQKAFKREE
jgi:hypothetical protein